MRIPLDYMSTISLYSQIESFIRHNIQEGQLMPGTRLPAARRLAESLGVSRITVDTAYAELEAAGLVLKKPGSGAYVLPPLPLNSQVITEECWPLWQQELHNRAMLSRTESLQAHLDLGISDTGIISFAEGGGDQNMYPVDDFRKALQTVMRRSSVSALVYGEGAGYKPLRETIAHVLTNQGISTRPENILITSGSQQALSLTLQVLLQSGDAVIVESPTYGRALDLFRSHGLKVIGVPVDEEGMQVEKLEGLLQQHHPKMIYTIPNFQNPTGMLLSGRRRRLLVSLADRYNVPIFEDDFVGDLRYEGNSQPALISLARKGRVIYTSTFSKMLLPGVRVGFVLTQGPVYDELVACKEVHDLATSTLMQHALQEYVSVGRYQAHLRRTCTAYKKRRDAMLTAIVKHLPSEVAVTPPRGGLFIWMRLPQGFSASKLLPIAHREGVTYSPGTDYFTGAGEGEGHMRLNFACKSVDVIETGLKRLGAAMDNMI